MNTLTTVGIYQSSNINNFPSPNQLIFTLFTSESSYFHRLQSNNLKVIVNLHQKTIGYFAVHQHWIYIRDENILNASGQLAEQEHPQLTDNFYYTFFSYHISLKFDRNKMRQTGRQAEDKGATGRKSNK